MEKNTKERAEADGIKVYCSYDNLVDVTELIPNPRNPNSHPENQIKVLSRIIAKQGWRQNITVSKLSGFVVKGHGRLLASQLLNVSKVPVEYQHYENEASEYADMIADNRIAELAQADDDLIKDLLNDIPNIDVDLTGYDKEALDQLNVDIDSFFEDDNEVKEDKDSKGVEACCPECGFKFTL